MSGLVALGDVVVTAKAAFVTGDGLVRIIESDQSERPIANRGQAAKVETSARSNTRQCVAACSDRQTDSLRKCWNRRL